MPLIKRSQLTKQGLNTTQQPITILDLSMITTQAELNENHEQILDVVDEESPQEMEIPSEPNDILPESYKLIGSRLACNVELLQMRFGSQSVLEYKNSLRSTYNDQKIRIRYYYEITPIFDEFIEIGFSTIAARERFASTFIPRFSKHSVTKRSDSDKKERHYVIIPKAHWNRLGISEAQKNTAATRERSSSEMVYTLDTLIASPYTSPLRQEENPDSVKFKQLKSEIAAKLTSKIEKLEAPFFPLYRLNDTHKKKLALMTLRKDLLNIPYNQEAHNQLNIILNEYEKHSDIISYRIRGFTATGKARVNNHLNSTEKLLQEIRKMVNPMRKDVGDNPKYNMREDIVHRLAHRIVELEATCNRLNLIQNGHAKELDLISHKKASLTALLTSIQKLPQETMAWTYRQHIEDWDDAIFFGESSPNKIMIKKHNGFFQSWNSADNDLLDILKKDLQVQADKNGEKKLTRIANAPCNTPVLKTSETNSNEQLKLSTI